MAFFSFYNNFSGDLILDALPDLLTATTAVAHHRLPAMDVAARLPAMEVEEILMIMVTVVDVATRAPPIVDTADPVEDTVPVPLIAQAHTVDALLPPIIAMPVVVARLLPMGKLFANFTALTC